ncbi:MAG: UvrD-helicase domain-containing protein, partial [Microbacteriaceae bacterium]
MGKFPDEGETLELNAEQQSLLNLPPHLHAVLLGAPGTGKTETLVQLVLKRVHVDGFDPAEIMILTPDRRSATALRDEVVLRLEQPVPGAMARSIGSLAFEIVNNHRIRSGKPPVTLLTGGEQDQMFAELLAQEDIDVDWPAFLGFEVRQLLGFRTELRDLWLRAIEYGIEPTSGLLPLAGPEDRGEWAAAQQFFQHYRQLLEKNASADAAGTSIDSAQLVSLAAALLAAGEVDPGDRVSQLRAVLLDDAQETVESSRRLLLALVQRGVSVIAAGDPDIMTARFRGALPQFLGNMATFLNVNPSEQPPEVQQIVLNEVYRFGPNIQNAIQQLTERIGTANAGSQRRMLNKKSPQGADEISIKLVDSANTEVQLIAAHLRRKHFLAQKSHASGEFASRNAGQDAAQDSPQGLSEGTVDWNEMAVIVRSRAMIPTLMRELAAHEVPVRFGGAQAPIRDQAVVRDLLQAARLVMNPSELNESLAEQLLLGPLGGLGRLEYRQLRRMLLLDQMGESEPKTITEVLLEIFQNPEQLDWLPQGKLLWNIENLVKSLKAATADTGNIEELLWGLWSRSKLAESYLAQSERGGLDAEIATAALDATVALFTLAARFVERNPNGKASDFIDHMLRTDLPEDNLAPKFSGSAVTLLTPAAAIASEYRVVVLAQVQENVWPDTRLRDTLLGAQKIAERVRPSGLGNTQLSLAELRNEVIQDEMRMFVQAISRASESVLITAINDEENGPSLFLNRLVDAV